MAVDERDCRRRGTVDVGDGRDRLVGEREAPGRTEMVERHGSGPLVSGGTIREATRDGCGGSQVAGDGVGRRPSCVGGSGGVGRAGVDTGLRAHRGVDVAGRGSNGMKKFRVPSAGLALSTAAEVAAPGDE